VSKSVFINRMKFAWM